MENQNLYGVESLRTHDSTYGLEMVVRCNGHCFHITTELQKFERMDEVLEQYLKFFELLSTSDEYPDDLEHWALKPLLSVFQSVASEPNEKETVNLQDYFSPVRLEYELYSTHGVLAAREADGKEHNSQPPGIEMNNPEYAAQWPSFYASHVKICSRNSRDALSQNPTNVRMPTGTTCFFKEANEEIKKSTLRELSTYQRIEVAKLEDGLRVPVLLGLVRDGETDRLLGMLLTHIDSGEPLPDVIKKASPSLDLRQQWKAQIIHILERLHAARIVWGDAKAANVLIDGDQNAWIIDFGGGYTEGWVEREKAGMIEGDLQGLAKIIDLLQS